MMEPEFIHLHVKTSYSILQSTIKTDALLDKIIAYNQPAVAITDRNNLFGAFEFSDHAAKVGIQPILGCEISLKNPYAKESNDDIVLIVVNEQGFANLRWLDSQLFLRKLPEDDLSFGEQFISFDELKEHSKGLIMLTGGINGAIAKLFLSGKSEEAEQLFIEFKEIFENNLYVELQRHDLPDERKVEKFLISLAYKYNVPLVATNNVVFTDESYFDAHEAMLCIKDKTVLDDPNRVKSNLNYRLKSGEEMKELFSDIPEAIENTVKIAKRSHYMITKLDPVLPKVSDNEAEKLRNDAREGLKGRMQSNKLVATEEEYLKRLEYELDVIISMGFAGYFLIVADFIKWSKDNDVPVGPGRGSGAGSMVAWAIHITDIDPIRFGLLFERFLNPERVSMPDFDIDFCKDGRERTIDYVCKKYGSDRVAQIITYGQMKAKAVVRDVGRVLGMGYSEVDRIAKLIPLKDEEGKLDITLKKALKLEPALVEAINSDEDVKHLFDIAMKLEGLHRNSGMHAAGIVIGNKPLTEIVPLYKDPDSDMPVAQFNMKYIESTSLVKFDFLGLKTLTVLKQTASLLGKGKDFLSSLPMDDKKTFELLSNGDTDAVFQFESDGMKDVLKRMKPDRIDDLIAVVSLYRPGPMANIPSYINRKHGREEVDYIYPSIESILKETYGIIIYQEQVMQISQIMAGYSLGGADLLRRAMGKKIQAEMDKQKPVFIEGATKRGVDIAISTRVFDLMAEFAKYGFNKSHAAAYAWISYQTAYLKAHYRLEFMCASMSNEKADTDKLNLFRKDCEKGGIKVLPPDVNHSCNNFVPEGENIRYAFSAIKGVGENAGEEVERERNIGGNYLSLSDFLKRVDIKAVNRKAMEGMIKAGVFDCFDINRKKLFYNLDAMMMFSLKILEEKQSSQISFFGLDKTSSEFELKENPEKSERVMTNFEKLEDEKSVIGFFLSDHPLKSFETAMKRMRTNKSIEIEDTVKLSPDGARFKLGVIITKIKKRINKKGNPFYLISFADMFGDFDAFCFDEVYKENKDLLEGHDPLYVIISGRLSDDGLVRINLHTVEKLGDAAARATSGIIINVKNKESVSSVKEILESDKEGGSQVLFNTLIYYGGKELKVEIPLKKHYYLQAETMDRLRTVNGIEIEEL